MTDDQIGNITLHVYSILSGLILVLGVFLVESGHAFSGIISILLSILFGLTCCKDDKKIEKETGLASTGSEVKE